MKKILLSLFISIISFGMQAQAQNEKPVKVSINLHFEIARPKFNCEYGLGICHFGLGSLRSVNTGINLNGNLITFYFNRSSMSDAVKAEFAKNAYFPIDEATTLPAEVWTRLGQRSERILQPGNYKIQTTPEQYIVSVPLE